MHFTLTPYIIKLIWFLCTTCGYSAAFQLIKEKYFFGGKSLTEILNDQLSVGYFLYRGIAGVHIL